MAQKSNEQEHAPTLKLLENGPMLYNGELHIEFPNGEVEKRNGVTALCRCGQSDSKPYCDGNHQGCGFKG